MNVCEKVYEKFKLHPTNPLWEKIKLKPIVIRKRPGQLAIPVEKEKNQKSEPKQKQRELPNVKLEKLINKIESKKLQKSTSKKRKKKNKKKLNISVFEKMLSPVSVGSRPDDVESLHPMSGN
jgi:hypothetical protein